MNISLEETQAEVAVIALNKMMRKSYFDICVISDVAKMLGIRPRTESYNILHALHCVDFANMTPSLRDKIPALIADCLGDPPAFQFNHPTVRPAAREISVIVAAPAAVDEPAGKDRPGLFKRLQLAFKG